MPASPDKIKQLAQLLAQHGFAGATPLNPANKNKRVIKRMLKGEEFYTFGITAIRQAKKRRQLSAGKVRDILVAASGRDLARFKQRGPGYIDPYKCAAALVAMMGELRSAASARRSIAFATGHPGAMVGFLTPLANWCSKLGGRIITLPTSIKVDGRYHLDMMGPVLVASDNCSAGHTHKHQYMDALLRRVTPNLVVADHGFAGSAINHKIPTIGFYDSDDPALPVAAYLGHQMLAVPINDNNYNANGKALAELLIQHFGQ